MPGRDRDDGICFCFYVGEVGRGKPVFGKSGLRWYRRTNWLRFVAWYSFCRSSW
jgi:hypothetical protein